MRIAIEAFDVQAGDTLDEQLRNCLDQLEEFLPISSNNFKNIISINFYLSESKKEGFRRQKEIVVNSLPQYMKENLPIAYLPQAPANGRLLSMEVWYLSNLRDIEITPKKLYNIPILILKNSRDHKILIANGIAINGENENLEENAERVFAIMEKILESEGMDFSNIIRQWNYIEDITNVYSDDTHTHQNYQIFNNIRAKFYSTNSFLNGYPAATGIGISTGSVIVSFLAASHEGFLSQSLENPFQKAAWNYSEEVLVGNYEYQRYSKCTPKFARAKYMADNESELVFVSGTASIREEKTIGLNDVAKQTEITLENIEKLLSKESMDSLATKKATSFKIDFIRVYLKNPNDYQIVQNICKTKLTNARGIYVISDVCRENLLVEIEAVAF